MPISIAAPALRLAFYGDDFTGSTDALEVLAFAGLRCALFLSVPDAETLRALGPFDAIGIAGDSRGMSPAEMDLHLAPVVAALARLPAALVHYKVCSTFDSSPGIGSIGRVMELARQSFGSGAIPIVAGTPALGRYCFFGNLFARSGTDGQVYRIDRHPIMSVHPVTPMTEADLARHLAAQTTLPIAKFTAPNFALDRAAMDLELARLMSGYTAGVLFDGTTPEHLTEAGRLLEDLCRARGRSVFSVGSSGLEYALTQWWRKSGTLGNAQRTTDYEHFDPVPQVLAVSGSASHLSALQIDAALAAGFVELSVDARALVAETGWRDTLDELADATVAALRRGASVMLHTARGAKDPRIAAMIDSLMSRGQSREQAKHEGGRLLGQRLGLLVDTVVRTVPLRRLLLSGGDTSSQITQRLAPDALLIAARLAPGAPLCRALSRQPHLRDLQIALKGGQMGQADYFVKALRGSA
jgi:3-oxoisoapionate kinase